MNRLSVVRRVGFLWFCTIGLFLGGIPLQAQDSKAIKAYNKAREAYARGEVEESLRWVDEALEKDPGFADPALFAGDVCTRAQQTERAQTYYDQAWKARPVGLVAFRIAESSFESGLYERAERFYRAYLEAPDRRSPYIEQCERGLLNAQFALSSLAQQRDLRIRNLGPNINSPAMEYFPTLSVDGSVLVFTFRDTASVKKDEDFKQSIWNGAQWEKADFLRGRINTYDNEGAQCISADGRFLVFTGCNRADGKGSCDLYYSSLGTDGQWSEPRNMGDSINTGQWETQPSLTADASALYFIRGKVKDKSNSDIYVAHRRSDGRFAKAVRLPEPVNTPDYESTPFIHFDGRSLFFASKGHIGMGGLDFFMSRMDDKGVWSYPINLGAPLNGPGDQSGLVVGADGTTAFFGSDSHPGGLGSFDLYAFSLPDSLRAQPTEWIKGAVVSAETGKPLKAEVSWTRNSDGQVFFQGATGSDGLFTATAPMGDEYALSVEAEGYLFYSSYHNLIPGAPRPDRIVARLEPLKSGSLLRLNNVFFSTASAALRPESRSELDRVVHLLKAHPQLRIRIEGHTDSEGEAAANQNLSERRAQSVLEYLVEGGIDRTRLERKGFGESAPIDTNDTESGRQNNRRTEIRIL